MRQKRSITLILFSMIFLFLIAGCNGGDGDILGPSSNPFLGGTKGLDIEFLKDTPPDEVTDTEFPFQVITILTNEGEFDLKANQVNVDLVGFLPSDFDASSSQLKNRPPDDNDDPTPRLRDSEGDIIEPVQAFVTFPGANENFDFLGQILGNTPFTFRAEVCYNYGTQAVAGLCVLENLIDVSDGAICNPRGSKSVFSSASPIGVTSFRQSVAGVDKIQFSFDIVHSGSGDVFKFETISASCPKSSSDRRLKEDRVKVTVNTGISGELKCIGVGEGSGTTNGIVRLINGRKTVTCTQDVGNIASDFERNVVINVDFNYFDKVEKKVLVKHLRTGGVTTTPPVDGGVPPPSGLSECGTTDAPPLTKCKANACLEFYDNCQPISANTCTCSSGSSPFHCVGACTQKEGVVDEDLPSMGNTVPLFALDIGSQYFVIQNVFDTGSGISSCTIDPEDDFGEIKNMRAQGQTGCFSQFDPCDFVGLKPQFEKDAVFVNMDVTCKDNAVDADGNPKPNQIKKSIVVEIKQAPPLGLELPQADKPVQQLEFPSIGELVTNVAVYDVETRFVVIDIIDLDVGLTGNNCKFFATAINNKEQAPHELEFGGKTLKGEFLNMDLEGPRFCRGKISGNPFNGPCSAQVRHKFETLLMSNGNPVANPARLIQSHIVCKNKEGRQTIKEVDIHMWPRGS